MTWDNNLIFFVGIAAGMVIQFARQQRRADARPSVVEKSSAEPTPTHSPDDEALPESLPTLTLTGLSTSDSAPDPTTLLPTADDWQQQAAIAMEVAQFKAGFLGRSAHELRSPLNGILGLHQLILNDLCDSPKEEREFLHQAYQGTLKALDLMDELIAISKLAVAPSPHAPAPVSLTDCWHEVDSLVHRLADNRNLRLDLVRPNPDIWVLGQAKLLRQLLVNLVNQAILSQDEGWIHGFSQVELTAAGTHWVEIYLKDQRPANAWQEPTNQLQADRPSSLGDRAALAKQWAQTWNETDRFYPSISLTWFLNQSLVHTLNGTIELLPAADCPRSPSGLDTLGAPDQIVVRCRLPLASAPIAS